MHGIVETFQGNRNCMWIVGDDGNTYFSHGSELVNTSNIKKGNYVTFDIEETDQAHPRAVNVVKTGHGVNHPFKADIDRIIEYLKLAPQSEERDFRIRDLETIGNYFSEVEDFVWCKNVKGKFRNNVNKNTDK